MFVPKNSSIFAKNSNILGNNSTWLAELFFFVSLLPLKVHGRSDTPPAITLLQWRQWEYCHMGCSDLSNIGANLVPVSLLVLLMAPIGKLRTAQQVILLLKSLPIKVASEYLVAQSISKKTSPVLGPKGCKRSNRYQ